jgi:hypothetical protein
LLNFTDTHLPQVVGSLIYLRISSLRRTSLRSNHPSSAHLTPGHKSTLPCDSRVEPRFCIVSRFPSLVNRLAICNHLMFLLLSAVTAAQAASGSNPNKAFALAKTCEGSTCISSLARGRDAEVHILTVILRNDGWWCFLGWSCLL